MSLRGALVDRARVVKKAASGTRVEGRTPMGLAYGPWFRARIAPPAGDEAQTSGRERVLSTAQITYLTTSDEGTLVHLLANQWLEVEAEEPLYNGVYAIQGPPQESRKRTGPAFVGNANLRRVQEPAVG